MGLILRKVGLSWQELPPGEGAVEPEWDRELQQLPDTSPPVLRLWGRWPMVRVSLVWDLLGRVLAVSGLLTPRTTYVSWRIGTGGGRLGGGAVWYLSIVSPLLFSFSIINGKEFGLGAALPFIFPLLCRPWSVLHMLSLGGSVLLFNIWCLELVMIPEHEGFNSLGKVVLIVPEVDCVLEKELFTIPVFCTEECSNTVLPFWLSVLSLVFLSMQF